MEEEKKKKKEKKKEVEEEENIVPVMLDRRRRGNHLRVKHTLSGASCTCMKGTFSSRRRDDTGLE